MFDALCPSRPSCLTHSLGYGSVPLRGVLSQSPISSYLILYLLGISADTMALECQRMVPYPDVSSHPEAFPVWQM